MQASASRTGNAGDPLEKAQAAAAAEVARNDGKAGAMLTASSVMAAILLGVLPNADLSGPVAALVGLGVTL
ncbi:hypothetical protein G3I55_44075, partial [Streptomyces sp. SID6648]|nr:hypothetical protein [Streptomyces sp. SID6648]